MKAKLLLATLILSLAVLTLSALLTTGCGTSRKTDGSISTVPMIYVSDSAQKRVYMINPSTLQIVGSIELTGADTPQWMAVNPDGKDVYVSDSGGTTPNFRIYVIDSETKTLKKPVYLASQTTGMALNRDGSKLFVACSGGIAAIIETANYSVLGYISGLGSDNLGIAYNSKNNKLYVTSDGDNKVYAVTAEAGSSATSVALPLAYHVSDVAVGPGGNSVYVTTYDDSGSSMRIVSIEADSLTIVSSFDTTGEGARYLALSPNKKYLAGAIFDVGYIDFLNLEDGSLEAVNVSDDDLKQLTFSPDGSKVFAVSAGVSPNHILIVNASATPRILTGVVTMESGSNCFGIVYKP